MVRNLTWGVSVCVCVSLYAFVYVLCVFLCYIQLASYAHHVTHGVSHCDLLFLLTLVMECRDEVQTLHLVWRALVPRATELFTQLSLLCFFFFLLFLSWRLNTRPYAC